MKFFQHNPNDIKNSSLYYDKFVFKEKRIMESRKNISSRINEILNGNTKNVNIKKNIRKLQDLDDFYYLDLKHIEDIKKLAKEKDIQKVIDKQIKERYKDILIKIATNSNDLFEKIKTLKRTRERMIKSISKRYRVVSFSEVYAKTSFLIGAGIPSIDEIGFYWSRNFGIPIIPGSTLKGAFRNYLEEIGEKYVEELFGTDEKRGSAIFLDVIPIDKITLAIEYQTPHFQKYYMDNKVPNDIYNPIPLSFLTVSSGKFRVDIILNNENYFELEKTLKIHLKEFLENYGLGAKSSSGYGRFKIENQ